MNNPDKGEDRTPTIPFRLVPNNPILEGKPVVWTVLFHEEDIVADDMDHTVTIKVDYQVRVFSTVESATQFILTVCRHGDVVIEPVDNENISQILYNGDLVGSMNKQSVR